MSERQISRDIEWRPVEGWPYDVSNTGKVRRIARGKSTHIGREIGHMGGGGYLVVRLSDAPRPQRIVKIHQLVAEAFLGPCPDGCEVNHRDGDPKNNRVDNLEYLTHADNIAHAYEIGLIPRRPMKLTVHDVREIRRRHAIGESMQGISRDFPVSYPTVRAIVRREKWKTMR